MKIDRRFLLRGTCQGALAVMGLPFLDCFLDSKGEALAATGRPLPTRFNTFFFGLGLTSQLWIPKIAGKDYEMTPQLKPLEAFRSKLNVFSGLRVPLDDNPNYMHWSGAAAAATGISPTREKEFDSKTIDQQIADVISRGARFKTVSAAAAGDSKHSYSSLGGANAIPAEPSPLSLYTRLFGRGFQDPTKGDWKPDPQVMIQQSVLSAVADNRKQVMQNLGTADRARMDQYFTSVREAELQMEAELQRPEIQAKVAIPDAPAEMVCNNALPNLRNVTPLMARLGALALATDQTRVFNLSVSEPPSGIFMPGDSLSYHQTTHEEPIDQALGYQPRVAQYNLDVMELFATLLKELDSIPEGDGTVLDHSLVFAFTDQSYARIHAVDGLPILVAGGASGRMKTGYHIAGDGSPVSRVGLTLLKAMGVPLDVWGKGSMQVRQPYTDLLT
ncbi:DUF1552 domain-containing protein [Bradyrhizobium iriomotense]|uniref:DUF1552 domain-containing protein n=1 Tax=Bradyrhizobium iriomotense TaxID=441950 RepID=A0ABQ6B0A3_9BRAD|nr:DUF1552 domain-containing protein [Bradyrhizobium iriomotense]GLR87583.1 hypothetical protein GCM10007857_42940 [Bradyrhizobium iriomotense]